MKYVMMPDDISASTERVAAIYDTLRWLHPDLKFERYSDGAQRRVRVDTRAGAAVEPRDYYISEPDADELIALARRFQDSPMPLMLRSLGLRTEPVFIIRMEPEGSPVAAIQAYIEEAPLYVPERRLGLGEDLDYTVLEDTDYALDELPRYRLRLFDCFALSPEYESLVDANFMRDAEDHVLSGLFAGLGDTFGTYRVHDFSEGFGKDTTYVQLYPRDAALSDAEKALLDMTTPRASRMPSRTDAHDAASAGADSARRTQPNLSFD